MWRLTPIAASQPTEEIAAIADQLGLEGIPNFLRLLARSRAATKAYLQAEAALAHGELAPHQREKIALLVAEINGSKYCRALHERTARQAGLTEGEIQLAKEVSSSNPKTLSLLHFVQAIVLQRGEVSNDDFSAIRKAGFSDSEIIEIVANIAANIFLNYFNILAQTEPDRSLSQTSPGNCPPKKCMVEAKL